MVLLLKTIMSTQTHSDVAVGTIMSTQTHSDGAVTEDHHVNSDPFRCCCRDNHVNSDPYKCCCRDKITEDHHVNSDPFRCCCWDKCGHCMGILSTVKEKTCDTGPCYFWVKYVVTLYSCYILVRVKNCLSFKFDALIFIPGSMQHSNFFKLNI